MEANVNIQQQNLSKVIGDVYKPELWLEPCEHQSLLNTEAAVPTGRAVCLSLASPEVLSASDDQEAFSLEGLIFFDMKTIYLVLLFW